jgi:hypothetical protein
MSDDSTSTVVPVTETTARPRPDRPTGGPLSDSQRNTIALMAVGGRPIGIIAQATRRSAATIRKHIKDDPDIHSRMSEYENRVIRAEALHRFKMLEYVDVAEAAIVEGLGSPDQKLRLDTAWKYVDRYVPTQAAQIDVNLNVEGQIEVGKALDVIATSIKGLTEAGVGNTSFADHVRKELPGVNALSDTPIEEKQ